MRTQRGNILFLILLAIILFVALSYAVSNGFTVKEDKRLSEERASSLAASMMQYGALVENGLHRMLLTKGIKIEQIDWRGAYSVNSTNSACSSTACRIFHADGGGITSMAVPLAATDMSIPVSARQTPDGSGEMQALIMGVKNVGTAAPDVVLLFRAVKQEVCEQVNIASGVYKRGDAFLNESFGSNYEFFQGTLTVPWPTFTPELGTHDARAEGKRSFCFYRSPTGGYYVAFVVYAL